MGTSPSPFLSVAEDLRWAGCTPGLLPPMDAPEFPRRLFRDPFTTSNSPSFTSPTTVASKPHFLKTLRTFMLAAFFPPPAACAPEISLSINFIRSHAGFRAVALFARSISMPVPPREAISHVEQVRPGGTHVPGWRLSRRFSSLPGKLPATISQRMDHQPAHLDVFC